MKVICKYCDGYLLDTDEVCPNCAAPNEHLMRSADGIPKTIEELKAFAAAKNLPLQQMRFFLGIDMREPRAFGIYKDEEDNFIVYKNKSNGERVVRYRGKDEAYAVNEIYQKMKTEVVEQKAYQAQKMRQPNQSYQSRQNNQQTSRNTNSSNKSSSNNTIVTLLAIIIVIIVVGRMFGAGAFFGSSSSHNSGYYDSYGGYYDDYDYDYDNNNDWDDDDSWLSDDDWDDDWDDDDWDYGGDWDDSYSDWDSDW